MPRTRRSLLLLVAAVLAVLLLLGVIGFFLFNWGGETPGEGTGDRITMASRL